jgi:hypothetical protein
MTEILTLASDFIERMSNPAYGAAVNEDYSLRFARLLSGERMVELLRHEAERVRDPEALTGHGWSWFLNWARSEDLDLNGDLLLALEEQWSSVFMQTLIIDVATRHSPWSGWQMNYVSEFPDEWLRHLMSRAIRQPVREERSTSRHEGEEALREAPPRTARAESTLIALLQVGREVTIDAAATLLHDPWIGHEQLVEFYFLRWNRLDQDTQRIWSQRLRMNVDLPP